MKVIGQSDYNAIRWERVNQYLTPFGTSDENSPEVGKGDLKIF